MTGQFLKYVAFMSSKMGKYFNIAVSDRISSANVFDTLISVTMAVTTTILTVEGHHKSVLEENSQTGKVGKFWDGK